MALESDVLVGISLAGIAMTAIFVIVINFFAGRNDKEKSHKTTTID